jgi:nicotinate-nucleotide adenylyltransferase
MAFGRIHLDRMLVAPVGLQPLKEDTASASFDDRMAMARLAFRGDPRIEISDLDAPLPGHRPNYTVETVLRLKSTLAPQDELFCLLGADSWLTIRGWYRASVLLTACGFIVGARPGFEIARAAAAVPQGFSVREETGDSLAAKQLWLSDSAGNRSRLYLLTDLAEDVSATEVRAALGGHPNANSGEVLDPEVARYIHEHGLYSSEV